MLVEISVFILISLLIAYLILYITGGNPTYSGEKGVYPLNTSNTIVMTGKDFPWTDQPSSLRFAIYVESAPRTLANIDCTNNEEQFAPSCTDYTYKPCKCATIDCGKCLLADTTTSSLSKLLSVGENFELWASGYTSQNDKPYVPALLKVKTATDGSQYFMESISLPAIPLRKWTVITIVKEGRRFDVYYGAKSVASKLLSHVPVPAPSSSNWVAGNSKWSGQMGLFLAMKKAVTSKDVENDLKALVNTRGVPYYVDQMKFDITSLSMPPCLFGNCNKFPEIKPMNPFAAYESNVS